MDCTAEPAQAQEDEPGVVITMNHSDDMIWDSDVDSQQMESDQESGVSATSTPEYKRGNHQEDTSITRQAIAQILHESKSFRLTGRRHPSILVLADAKLLHWPKDTSCQVEMHSKWTLDQWLSALRAEIIRVSSYTNTVVLYLEITQRYTVVPHLKNKLQAICAAIKKHNKGTKIFISNTLPDASSSPMSVSRLETNFVLLQAVRSINRSLGKIHFMTLHEHFVSSKGKLIPPVQKILCNESTTYRIGMYHIQGVFVL